MTPAEYEKWVQSLREDLEGTFEEGRLSDSGWKSIVDDFVLEFIGENEKIFTAVSSIHCADVVCRNHFREKLRKIVVGAEPEA